jgi:aconitate hydratase
MLLGVRAVIAVSYERIHRSNLAGMGVLPLQFRMGETTESLGLTGEESFTIEGLSNEIVPRQQLTVVTRSPDGTSSEIRFPVTARLDTSVEIEYYRHGGILPMVLRNMLPT